MPDNPQPMPEQPSGGFFALSDHRVLALAGRDAVAFAQAQFMNDVAALPVGHWQWNGWLTPKGRVIALFALLKRDGETLWLVLPDAEPGALAEQLRRYVFRSKVTLAAHNDLVAGAFRPPAQAAGTLLWGDEEVELDVGGDDGARVLRIGPTPAIADAAALARWKAFDLMHGLPRLPASQAEQWTPQMLSLERLRAFSVKKGCYPGQEIVARTHFLGQAKRGLALLVADAEINVGAEVRADGQVLGNLVCVAADGPQWIAQAVMPRERAEAGLSVDGVPLRELPLQAGLAR